MKKIIYSIEIDDIQEESLIHLERKLSDDELEIVRKKLEWGINTSLPIIYDSIFDDIKYKQYYLALALGFNAFIVFEDKKIRTHWDDMQEKWFFSIVDVVSVLRDTDRPRKYWSDLKAKLKKEGSETVTNCNALKLQATDGNRFLLFEKHKHCYCEEEEGEDFFEDCGWEFQAESCSPQGAKDYADCYKDCIHNIQVSVLGVDNDAG